MKGKRILLLGMILSLFLISFISADTAFFIPKNNDYCIKFSCELNGGLCSAGAACNLSINYPNSSQLVSNINTTNLNNGYFEYCLNSTYTSINGEHQARASCIDGGLNDTSTFTYEVNPTGIRPSDQKTASLTRGIYFFSVIALLFFIAFLFIKQTLPMKWTYFIFSFIFFLIALNMLSVGVQDEVINTRLENFFDSFTAISTYMYWFCAAALAIMWAFTFLQTWLYNKTMAQARKFGINEPY